MQQEGKSAVRAKLNRLRGELAPDWLACEDTHGVGRQRRAGAADRNGIVLWRKGEFSGAPLNAGWYWPETGDKFARHWRSIT
jgi:hypothetical protein